jgi:hypothetical protein
LSEILGQVDYRLCFVSEHRQVASDLSGRLT